MWRKRRLRLAEAAAHRRAARGHVLVLPRDREGRVGPSRHDRTGRARGRGHPRHSRRHRARHRGHGGGRGHDAARPPAAQLEAQGRLRRGTGRAPRGHAGWWEEMLGRDPEELEDGEEAASRRCRVPAAGSWKARCCRLRDPPQGAGEPAAGPRAGVREALDANKLERLGRYEVHLDRKLERMLAMLFKLQELRRRRRTRADPFRNLR